ncbi:hypothetical protein CNYM01_06936 [Colletotrichum nymphaeae SA-01]|uniref:Uncharacterized protein n=1 Tax=Colletotrichum nymphaeae SA-01 TaxID=1460502 RepID=A0A135TLY9_9PEZI|nr:hypothetical protein CNYM01_06936 [Colletotrichum nymphaeae SA-01]
MVVRSVQSFELNHSPMTRLSTTGMRITTAILATDQPNTSSISPGKCGVLRDSPLLVRIQEQLQICSTVVVEIDTFMGPFFRIALQTRLATYLL